jgi:hypothetical protein
LVAIKPHKLGYAILAHWPITAQALHNLFKVLFSKVYGLIRCGVAGKRV